ncbi:hypothetical protein [Helicobacter ganmani]|uniref:hypothetical protein n=1 Tax=Helicobacter ganmani TaxID=60246 RepID=UPI00261F7D93|nr:hypothetical protein [uncultured Helicobacter sp.]
MLVSFYISRLKGQILSQHCVFYHIIVFLSLQGATRKAIHTARISPFTIPIPL